MAKYKTEQRKLMQEFFADHPHEMFSAKHIFEVLGEGTISISAVYRNLSELESYGLVRRCTKSGSREAFYQYTGIEDCREHIHLTCKKCGKTIHMALDDTDELVRNASKYKNFAVDRTATVLLGICGACRNT